MIISFDWIVATFLLKHPPTPSPPITLYLSFFICATSLTKIRFSNSFINNSLFWFSVYLFVEVKWTICKCSCAVYAVHLRFSDAFRWNLLILSLCTWFVWAQVYLICYCYCCCCCCYVTFPPCLRLLCTIIRSLPFTHTHLHRFSFNRLNLSQYHEMIWMLMRKWSTHTHTHKIIVYHRSRHFEYDRYRCQQLGCVFFPSSFCSLSLCTCVRCCIRIQFCLLLPQYMRCSISMSDVLGAVFFHFIDIQCWLLLSFYMRLFSTSNDGNFSLFFVCRVDLFTHTHTKIRCCSCSFALKMFISNCSNMPRCIM